MINYHIICTTWSVLYIILLSYYLYYLLYNILRVSYIHLFNGADVCWNQSLVCNANPYDTSFYWNKRYFKNYFKIHSNKKGKHLLRFTIFLFPISHLHRIMLNNRLLSLIYNTLFHVIFIQLTPHRIITGLHKSLLIWCKTNPTEDKPLTSWNFFLELYP